MGSGDHHRPQSQQPLDHPDQNLMVADDEFWAATSQGYTPLQDTSTGGEAVFSHGVAGSVFSSNPERLMGAFMEDSSNYHDGDDTSAASEVLFVQGEEAEASLHVPQVTTASTPTDLLGIADNALMALDSDYQTTLSIQIGNEEFEKSCQDPSDSKLETLELNSRKVQELGNPSKNAEVFADKFEINTGKTPSAHSVDTDAVRRAVANMQSRHPTFQTKYQQWSTKTMRSQRASHHPIIPSRPLSAFTRSTTKACEAASRLSRSATAAEALHRLNLVGNSSLRVHVLGANASECDPAVWAPLIRWLGNQRLVLDLIGPDVVPTSPSTTHLQSHPLLCQDWYRGKIDKDHPLPDMIIAFNAGIWGYASWKEGLTALPPNCPLVVTAYTLQEAEDDTEVLQAERRGQCLWEAQPNPFASRLDRPTQSSHRRYRENAAWQAWV